MEFGNEIIAGAMVVVFQFGILVFFGPIIIWIFKQRGGIMGTIAGGASKASHSITEAVKGSEHDPDSMRNTIKKNWRGARIRAQAKTFRRLNEYSRSGNVGHSLATRAAGVAGMGNVLAKESALNEEAKKRIYSTKDNGDDSVLNARTSTIDPDGVRRTLDGKEVSPAEWNAAKKYYRTLPELQAIEAYRETKTLSTEDAENYTRRFAQLGKQEGWNEGEMGGHWISTGFARQDERGEFKHGTWKKDAAGNFQFTRVGDAGSMYSAAKAASSGDLKKGEGKADAFLNEQYYKKGSYKGSQMMSSYFDSMANLKQGYLKRVQGGAPPATAPAEVRAEYENAKSRLKQITEIENAFEQQRIDPDTGRYESGLSGASAGTMAAFNRMKEIGIANYSQQTYQNGVGQQVTVNTPNYTPEMQQIRTEVASGRTHEAEREQRRAAAPASYVP